MSGPAVSVAALLLTIGEFAPDIPRGRQLAHRLREAILLGELAGGARLPSTRTLSAELRLSRNTVVAAVEQLVAEGYVEAREREGRYVVPGIARALPSVKRVLVEPPAPQPAGRRGTDPDVGLPDVAAFAAGPWRRLATAALREAAAWGYAAPCGAAPLREAIARHVAQARGVRVGAANVIVVEGTQQAVALASRTLAGRERVFAMEDPGYTGVRSLLEASQHEIVPIPVDGDGANVAALGGVRPRLLYVTPAHQYPLGVRMSLARRLAVLDFARASDAYVIEDDYDGEFRYDARPQAALQSLDTAGRVIYVGTFSKALAPALRIAYAIVPDDLIERFERTQRATSSGASAFTQTVLARFIAGGHFTTYVQRMLPVYAARRTVLLDQLERACPGRLQLLASTTGLHVTGLLDGGADDRAIALAVRGHGLPIEPLSRFSVEDRRRGLVLGFGPATEDGLRAGVARLASVLREAPSNASLR